MTLLERVTSALQRSGVAHALIGAAAMGAHGVSRATVDQDLLVVDPRVLDATLWRDLSDVSIDIRRGSDDDPLAGVIRFRLSGARDVDVVVGRAAWQREVIERATPVRLGTRDIPVVTAADLILLKLFAGGSQDKWDIEQLLATDSSGALRTQVESRLAMLPRACRVLWRDAFG